jgi:hypothetical protein
MRKGLVARDPIVEYVFQGLQTDLSLRSVQRRKSRASVAAYRRY